MPSPKFQLQDLLFCEDIYARWETREASSTAAPHVHAVLPVPAVRSLQISHNETSTGSKRHSPLCTITVPSPSTCFFHHLTPCKFCWNISKVDVRSNSLSMWSLVERLKQFTCFSAWTRPRQSMTNTYLQTLCQEWVIRANTRTKRRHFCPITASATANCCWKWGVVALVTCSGFI